MDGENVGAMNAFNKIVELPDPEATAVWLDNYCQANPLQTLAEAASQLYGGLKLHAPKREP